jgi:hypothetical protein
MLAHPIGAVVITASPISSQIFIFESKPRGHKQQPTAPGDVRRCEKH